MKTSDVPVCGAKLKQAREDGRTTCENPAGARTDHLGFGSCRLHGGGTPNGKKHAQKQAAESTMKAYGVDNPIPTDPVAGLLLEIARTAGSIEWLRLQIAALDDSELYSGEMHVVVSTGFESGERKTSGLRIHVLIEQYHKERKLFAAMCRDAIKLDIAERQVKLWEDIGVKLGKVLTYFLDNLELDEDQQSKAPALVDQALRLLIA